MLGSDCLPIGVEVKFPVTMTKPVEEMTGLEAGPTIEPYALLERGDEQVVATETLAQRPGFRRSYQRVGVVNDHGADRRAVAEVPPVAGEDWANTGLVEGAGR